MRVYDVEQGTSEWHRARLGIPTASMFDQLVKDNGGLTGDAARSYAKKLVYEIITGEPLQHGTTHYMERGHDLEPEAVRTYEFLTDRECTKVGFITDDDRTMGCSPDRLVGIDGGLEIKCPAAWTHIDYLLDPKHGPQYKQQVQGCMLITGRKWWDRMFYHPLLDPVIVRFEVDPDYQASIAKGIKRLHDLVLIQLETLWKRGHIDADRIDPQNLNILKKIPGFELQGETNV